jgi:hypothetical protein
MLVENFAGNYTFIRGIGPFSAAALARPGYAIMHASFKPFAPLATGYDRIEQYLEKLKRPISALNGIQLRIPRPLSREGFDEFNRPYIEKLRAWGLEVEGANPVTRTNVALDGNPIAEPMIASFFYTVPSAGAAPTWVVSGVPEIASRDGAIRIVAPNNVTPDGLRQKTQCILEVIARHLAELHASWAQATTLNLYAVHDLHPLITTTILPAIGAASRVGITWHHARPPVNGLEMEIDAWAVEREEILSA